MSRHDRRAPSVTILPTAARSPRELAEHPHAGVECLLKRTIRLGAEGALGLQVRDLLGGPPETYVRATP